MSMQPNTIRFNDLPSFSLREKIDLPKSKVIYFVLDGENKILYIGYTVNLRARFYKHHHEKEFLSIEGCKIAWILLNNTTSGDDIESLYIRYFKPPLNKIPLSDSGIALTNAEHQRLYRQRRKEGIPIIRYEKSQETRTLHQRWQENVRGLRNLQREYQNWRDNLPESLQETPLAEKLQEVCDIDLDVLEVELPRGFGRD